MSTTDISWKWKRDQHCDCPHYNGTAITVMQP